MAEGDPAFGQIVWRKFQRDLVARKYANSVAAKPSREVRKHHPFVFQLDAEETAGEFLQQDRKSVV